MITRPILNNLRVIKNTRTGAGRVNIDVVSGSPVCFLDKLGILLTSQAIYKISDISITKIAKVYNIKNGNSILLDYGVTPFWDSCENSTLLSALGFYIVATDIGIFYVLKDQDYGADNQRFEIVNIDSFKIKKVFAYSTDFDDIAVIIDTDNSATMTYLDSKNLAIPSEIRGSRIAGFRIISDNSSVIWNLDGETWVLLWQNSKIIFAKIPGCSIGEDNPADFYIFQFRTHNACIIDTNRGLFYTVIDTNSRNENPIKIGVKDTARFIDFDYEENTKVLKVNTDNYSFEIKF